MEIVYKGVGDLIPYEKNPRNNEQAVDKVANSIREFGFKVPIVVDKYNVVVCGHTRLKAAKKLGLTEVPCVYADDLTDQQIKAYRIADNKVSELASWDDELLTQELEDITDFDMSQFGVEEMKGQELDEEKYVSNGQTPVYDITSECPNVQDLYDRAKTKDLLMAIDNLEAEEDVKEFLKAAAQRFTVFSFSKIAEFYAHQEADVQEVMEKLALVIVDYDKAIENGFADFRLSVENEAEEE